MDLSSCRVCFKPTTCRRGYGLLCFTREVWPASLYSQIEALIAAIDDLIDRQSLGAVQSVFGYVLHDAMTWALGLVVGESGVVDNDRGSNRKRRLL